MEIYVRNATVDEVEAWMQEVFDAVETVREAPAWQAAVTHEEATVTSQITLHVQAGDWTSVWFEDGDLPWDTVTACARSAYDAVGKETLCYPDRHEDEPWKMLRLHPDDGESFVDERDVDF
jgi:hypothetical protein